MNTRVPRAVWLFIIVTHIWALVMWVMLPAWPLVTTYTMGVLGIDQREEVEQDIALANVERSDWSGRIDALSADEILASVKRFCQKTNTTLCGEL